MNWDRLITLMWLWGVAIVARWLIRDAAIYWADWRKEQDPQWVTYEEFQKMPKPWYVKVHWWLKNKGL